MPGFFDEMDNIERVDSRLAKIEKDIKRIWQALNDVKGDVDSRLVNSETFDFAAAVKHMKAGKKVKRLAYQAPRWAGSEGTILSGFDKGGLHAVSLDIGDFEATDWMLTE